jgi:Uma2 family endonuclease
MPRTILYDPPEIEYLDGHPHPKVSPTMLHGLVQCAVVKILSRCAGTRGLVVTEVRFEPGAIDRTPTELIPDVAFVSHERLVPLKGEARDKPPFSPDVAVEVRSPKDDSRYLADKIARYLATGAILVLDIDPKTRTVVAHTAKTLREFGRGDTFEDPVVPWLTFEAGEVFADLDAYER